IPRPPKPRRTMPARRRHGRRRAWRAKMPPVAKPPSATASSDRQASPGEPAREPFRKLRSPWDDLQMLGRLAGPTGGGRIAVGLANEAADATGTAALRRVR